MRPFLCVFAVSNHVHLDDFCAVGFVGAFRSTVC